MKLASFLIKSTLVVGLLFVIQKLFFKPRLSLPELQDKIDSYMLAAVKSAQLVMEKTGSSFLRELTQNFHNDLVDENSRLKNYGIKGYQSENPVYPKHILIEAETLVFNYEYNEDLPFDLAFAAHQVSQAAAVEALFRDAIFLATGALQETLSRSLSIFLRYQSELDAFIETFLTVNEYRIRDIAHQIWEAEGRPEGQAVRHWVMAVDILRKISTADLQLALEQRRSLFDAFSTAPEISSPFANKSIH